MVEHPSASGIVYTYAINLRILMPAVSDLDTEDPKPTCSTSKAVQLPKPEGQDHLHAISMNGEVKHF